MFPGGLSDDERRPYVRYRAPDVRGPASDAAQFFGTRVSISAAARGAMQASDMQLGSEQIWFSIADSGGFVDIRDRDILLDVMHAVSYAVIAMDEDGGYLKVTVKTETRRRA